MAHAVRVDAQDNIWVVDEGTDTIMKFNPAGRVVMVLGPAARKRRGPGSHARAAALPRLSARHTIRPPDGLAWDAAGKFLSPTGTPIRAS